MILLLTEALRHRERVPDAARDDVPVPVWLTLGSWDPRSQGLRDWVTATIGLNHPYLRATDFGPDAVAQLFDTGHIALFLDGLDEMPDTLRGQALERLTAEAARQRVVITSRPGEFRETVDTGQQLPYTAVVELRPVGSRAAARYLLEGQIGDTRQAWQDIADYLLARPDGVLARTLNTPLTLSLARSAYRGDDPRGMLTGELVDEQTLRSHLLDHVLVAAYPDPGERDHATYWLGWLAHHMSTEPSGPTRDLYWWQIPGWINRWQVGLVGALVGGLLSGLMVWFLVGSVFALVSGRMFWLVGGYVFGLGFGLVFGVVFGLVVGLKAKAVTPRPMTIRWPKRQDLSSGVWRSGLVVGFVFGLVGLVAVLAPPSAPPEFAIGVFFAFCFVGMLVVGLTLWLVDAWRVPLAAILDVTPRTIYQRSLRSQLMEGPVVGLIAGLAFGVVFGLVFGLTLGPVAGLKFASLSGVVFGLVGGLVGGLRSAAMGGAASSLLFTEIVLRLRARRVRFMPLLQTALMRQVLRQAGAVYQFRHADLQDRLADHYEAQLTGHRTA
jgi:hypothetical protein